MTKFKSGVNPLEAIDYKRGVPRNYHLCKEDLPSDCRNFLRICEKNGFKPLCKYPQSKPKKGSDEHGGIFVVYGEKKFDGKGKPVIRFKSSSGVLFNF